MTEQLLGKIRAARTLSQFARAFRNWRAVWAAYRVNAPLPTFRLRDGLTIEHEPGDKPIVLFREIFLDQCYTRGGFYRPRAHDVVLDIGANIGMFALWLQSQARGIAVHSFEPASATRERLKRNLAANQVDNFVHVHSVAVTNVCSMVSLKRAESSGETSLFSHATTLHDAEELVPTITLAEAVALTGASSIDFLKIDVEGSEIEIVEGAGAETWSKIERVAIEYHDLFRPGCRERVTLALERQGFRSIETIPVHGLPDLGLIRARRQ
jgi:FkbM family methyltransferase